MQIINMMSFLFCLQQSYNTQPSSYRNYYWSQTAEPHWPHDAWVTWKGNTQDLQQYNFITKKIEECDVKATFFKVANDNFKKLVDMTGPSIKKRNTHSAEALWLKKNEPGPIHDETQWDLLINGFFTNSYKSNVNWQSKSWHGLTCIDFLRWDSIGVNTAL